MKKTLLSIVAVAALAAAGGAMAQPYGGYDRGDNGRYDNGRYENGAYNNGRGYNNGAYNINQRQQQIAFRIDRGQRDGSLSWREARSLRGQLAGIENLERRYRAGGLNGWERADLDRRLDVLAGRLRMERRDGDYGSGYGRGWERR